MNRDARLRKTSFRHQRMNRDTFVSVPRKYYYFYRGEGDEERDDYLPDLCRTEETDQWWIKESEHNDIKYRAFYTWITFSICLESSRCWASFGQQSQHFRYGNWKNCL